MQRSRPSTLENLSNTANRKPDKPDGSKPDAVVAEADAEGKGGCSAEQHERLAKCQKSLEQLEFSLNNLLLNASLATGSNKNRRRLEDADRFLTDLVDSIRARRSQRTQRLRPPKMAQAQQTSDSAADMRRKLADESRALWRAQNIGARCEDTVDRYMLDVVIDKLGEMANQADRRGGETKRKGRTRWSGSLSPSCGKCGGSAKMVGKSESGSEGASGGANRHNSSRRSRRGRGRGLPGESDSGGADGLILFKKRLQRSDAPRPMRRDTATSNCRQPQLRQHQHHHKRHLPASPQLQLPPCSSMGSSDSLEELPAEERHQDMWSLRTWQPILQAANNSARVSTGCTHARLSQMNNSNACGAKSPPPSRRATDLLASVAAYRRGSRRYEKALRVAAYLRDLCREFYRNSCAGRAPPAAQSLEAILAALVQLVDIRNRAVALAVRCTACPALCASERLCNPQLCRLQNLLRLACTQGNCAGGAQLNVTEALADADQSSDRCRLLRRLHKVATFAGGQDADYRRLFNALASLTELRNCAANYAQHRRRMCGTAPALGTGPRGISRADMRALALDLVAHDAEVASDAADAATGDHGLKCPRTQRLLCRSNCQSRGSGVGGQAMALQMVEALHNPREMGRRLRMHRFATGAAMAVKANEAFKDP